MPWGVPAMGRDATALDGLRIMVVEDDYLIAQVLAELLQDAGAEVMGPFGWMEEAIEFLRHDSQRLDGAVLDINLHGRKSYPIADLLIARSVRFMFATGYGNGAIEEKYARYPRCEKPFSGSALITFLMGC